MSNESWSFIDMLLNTIYAFPEIEKLIDITNSFNMLAIMSENHIRNKRPYSQFSLYLFDHIIG